MAYKSMSLCFREEHPSNTGGRFSKSSSEREEMLVQRKEGMVEQARR